MREEQSDRKRERERQRQTVRGSKCIVGVELGGNCCHMTFDLASDWRIYNLKQVANKADERPEAQKEPMPCQYPLVALPFLPTYTFTYKHVESNIHTHILASMHTRIEVLLSNGHANINRLYGPLLTVTLCVWECVCVYVWGARTSVGVSILPEVIKTIITA